MTYKHTHTHIYIYQHYIYIYINITYKYICMVRFWNLNIKILKVYFWGFCNEPITETHTLLN